MMTVSVSGYTCFGPVFFLNGDMLSALSRSDECRNEGSSWLMQPPVPALFAAVCLEA